MFKANIMYRGDEYELYVNISKRGFTVKKAWKYEPYNGRDELLKEINKINNDNVFVVKRRAKLDDKTANDMEYLLKHTGTIMDEYSPYEEDDDEYEEDEW